MIFRTVALAIALTVLTPNWVATQRSARFGTCAYWQDQKPDPTKPSVAAVLRAYRGGFAQGFALGALGRIPGEPHPDLEWEQLEDKYQKGFVEVLQRPAILVDALDAKCGDYKNRTVSLEDVGLLVLLEIGGAQANGIEKALEVFRGGGDPTRALNALIAAK